MAKRKPMKAEQFELPLQAELPLSGLSAELWSAVEALPAKAQQHHRDRKKTVKPKLRQVQLLEDDGS